MQESGEWKEAKLVLREGQVVTVSEREYGWPEEEFRVVNINTEQSTLTLKSTRFER